MIQKHIWNYLDIFGFTQGYVSNSRLYSKHGFPVLKPEEAPSALRLVTRHIGTCHGIVQHDVQEMNLSNMNERFPFVRKLTGIGSDLEKDLAKRSAIRVKLI